MNRAFALFVIFLLFVAASFGQVDEPKPQPAPNQNLPTAGVKPPTLQRACIKCGFVCDVRLKFCGMCGVRMPVLQPTSSTAVAKWGCTKCKTSNPANNKFCGACGTLKAKPKAYVATVTPKTTSAAFNVVRFCVNCGERKTIDLRKNSFCSSCGSVLSRASAYRTTVRTTLKKPSVRVTSTAVRAIHCTQCGVRNLASAKNCVSCGRTIKR